MFRRTVPLALALALALATTASAQSVDDVIAKSLAARGGLDKIKAIQTVRMSGKTTIGPGMDAPTIITMKRPNQLRTEFTVQGMTGIQSYDGKSGWMVMPFMGKKDPEAMSADELKLLTDEADIDGPLVDWKAKGNQVELQGKEQVEGSDAYKLKVTLKSGTVRTLYLDADSYLEIKSEGKITMNGTDMEFESVLGDYKEVNGVMFPFATEQGMKGSDHRRKTTIEKVEINATLADNTFAMPAKPDSSVAVADSAKAPVHVMKGSHKAEPASKTPAPTGKP